MIKNPLINREISWLSFNTRVLQEAEDPRVPLLERLKFLGIYSSNLDEFFSVRVGTIIRLIQANEDPPSFYSGTPRKILRQIESIVIKNRDRFEQTFGEIIHELEEENVYFINETQLSPLQENYIDKFFHNKLRPRLIPIMLNHVKQFPYLKSLVIYLAVQLKLENGKTSYAIIEVPTDVLNRFVILPSEDEKKHIIMLDDVIRYGLKEIFSIFAPLEARAFTIKITRDAEFDVSEDVTISFFEKMSQSLEQRKTSYPVRIVYDGEIPDKFLKFILSEMELNNHEKVISGGRYHNARDFINFPKLNIKHLRYAKKTPLPHHELIKGKSVMKVLDKKDLLLHFPYQSFHSFIDLLREAAIDPNVKSIYMTLYRVAKKSNVINALMNAVQNGKKVSVLLELQARFDEEANIYWTQKLESAGAHIISGIPGVKIHSKLCLITRKANKSKKYYSCIGTGNFNESTAKLYTDHLLMTSAPKITNEVRRVFRFLENTYRSTTYRKLVVAPFSLRNRLTRMIRQEMKNAKEGKPAFMHIKINSLVDKRLITLLYKASQAGVKIKMIVRGICSLVPQLPGISENIEIYSIVDKYLEHSRIYIFHANGSNHTFLSSADWMVRNLDNRIEVAVPIEDYKLKQEIYDYMEIQFRDNTKSRIFNNDLDNSYRTPQESVYSRAQDDIYNWLKIKTGKNINA